MNHPPVHPVTLSARIALTIVLVAALALLLAKSVPTYFREYWKRLVFWVLVLGLQALWMWWVAVQWARS